MEKITDRKKRPEMPFFRSQIGPEPALSMEMKIADRLFHGSSETAREFYMKDMERIHASLEINREGQGMLPSMSAIKKRKI